MPPPVLIVGGGIGGLSTALALSRCGIESRVFERYGFEDNSGAGIQLSPNATRLLFQFGIEDELRHRSSELRTVVTRHWKSGATSAEVPLGARLRNLTVFPYLQIRRNTLIELLVNRIRPEPSITLHDNEEIESFETTNSAVLARTCRDAYEGHMLIAADGTHSSMRGNLITSPTPKFAKWIAWRTIVDTVPKRLKHAKSTNIWCGHDGHVVHYPVTQSGILNCIFVTKTKSSFSSEWRQRGSIAELREYFSEWNEEVVELIDCINPTSLYCWGLFKHRTQRMAFTGYRAALLGDSCHTVLPFLAQGAALAIEDAVTIADCLNTSNDLATSLRRYELFRRTRTRRIQRQSEAMGVIYHLHEPFAWFRNKFTRLAIYRLIRDVYLFDAHSSK